LGLGIGRAPKQGKAFGSSKECDEHIASDVFLSFFVALATENLSQSTEDSDVCFKTSAGKDYV